ncbi:MAG: hypothetical protein HeimC2_32800 [Candidatus Heimdallarchaeota archaeon LC_2]|nr:MAG: hypothetical protein HeimC2_32800 [Candidatus Heimdallarchaeota archaeon LC_2]
MSVINQLLNQDSNCTDILEIMLDFSPLESLLYFHLIQNGERTVVQLCKETNRKQSTVHVALQNLVSHGICIKKKKNKAPRGYEFAYTAKDPVVVQSILRQRLERLYECTSKCIDTFSSKAPTCEITFN